MAQGVCDELAHFLLAVVERAPAAAVLHQMPLLAHAVEGGRVHTWAGSSVRKHEDLVIWGESDHRMSERKGPRRRQ